MTIDNIFFANIISQIQTIEPEGEKLIWVFLIIVLISLIVWIFIKGKKFSIPNFSKSIIVRIDKNKIYHPSIITLNIINNSKKAITIQHPIIRFKKIKEEKAFKIKAVNSTQIYPLYLETGKTHKLPVLLVPFYEFDEKLKRFSRVRIEFNFDNNKKKKTRYILLKPTLFRKA